MGPFERRLAVIAAGALTVRAYAAYQARDHLVQGDAMVFHQVADRLADGQGFRQAFEPGPTAEHPPAWEVVLAAANLLGADGYFTHRLVGALLGTITVVLIGLLAHRVAGRPVAYVAAGLAAVYPMLYTADVSLMSESLYGAFLVAALLAAHARRPVALGVLLGLAALTRGEALILVALLVVPLFWGQKRRLVVALAAFALVLAPWTIRNLATFAEPVLISTNANGIWKGANCPDVYSGPLIGAWRFQCYSPARPGEDESEYFARQRDEGLSYAFDNLGRAPAVVTARLGRVLDVWDVDQALYLNAQEGRLPDQVRRGIRMAWALMLLSVAGAFVLRRRRHDLLVLLAPVALVLLVAAVTYGTTRFRFAAEPSLCILAAVALVTAAGALRERLPARPVSASARG
jgi:4-amino-4-deoxy-L-arabinose transferase-like glycosyltransferase